MNEIQPGVAPAVTPQPDPPNTGILKLIYTVSLLAGLGGAIYVFLVAHLSETLLVRYSPFCMYPFVFGAYGLLAERGLRRVRQGKASSLGAVFGGMARLFGLVGVLLLGIMLLPLLILSKLRNSLVIALIGAGFWAFLLWFFFVGIFPSL